MPIFKMRLRTLMGLVALVALLLGYILHGTFTLGIGHTTLKTTFVVADATTSRPIGWATIEFREEAFPSGSLVVKTMDSAGKYIRADRVKVASRHNGWKTTFATCPPDITFRISAPGHESTAWMPLYSKEYFAALKSDHPVSTLDVKVRLSKSPSVPSNPAERVQP